MATRNGSHSTFASADCDHGTGLPRTTSGGCERMRNSPCGCVISMTQLVRYVVLLFTMQGATRGQDPGPSYKTNRACVINSECNTGFGEVCWWSFDGCAKGECMCPPKWSYQDSSGRCRQLKIGHDKCDSRDKCPSGMSCKQGHCLCTGLDSIMTHDRRSCLKPNHKLMGSPCTPDVDTCYQRRTYHDYTSNDMRCHPIARTCRCRDGLKDDGRRCMRWNIGEKGCSKDHHCQGGALCLDGSCQCPSGYMDAAGGVKCIKLGANYGLQIGEYCDEIHERRYCDRDLVCHRCTQSRQYNCVKYLPPQPESGAYGSHSPKLMVSMLTVLIVTVVTTLATCMPTMSR